MHDRRFGLVSFMESGVHLMGAVICLMPQVDSISMQLAPSPFTA